MHPRVKLRRWLPAKQLEDRLTPSAYFPKWLDPGHLTLSFVPNGTSIGSVNSSLLNFLNR